MGKNADETYYQGLYIEDRRLNNYIRFNRALTLLIAMSGAFLVRNIYFCLAENLFHSWYFYTYTLLFIGSLFFKVSLYLFKKNFSGIFVDRYIILISLYFFLTLTSLSLLDSFEYISYDFTAYIFGGLMMAFLLRCNRRVYTFLYLSGMIYYIVVYFIVHPEALTLAGLFPLAACTVFAFYFATMRESMDQRLFITTKQLEESNFKLEKETQTDVLTGLHNRKYMKDFIEYQLGIHRRHKNKFCLLFADIDYFKKVNDKLGHNTGDIVLKEFAELLKKESRNTDLIIRYGGEEFLMVLTDTAQEHAVSIAERIRYKVENHTFSSVPWKLTASFGVACAENHDSVESLIERADSSLYSAKKNGRNKCCLS